MRQTARTLSKLKLRKMPYKRVKCKICSGTGWNKRDPSSGRCKKCNGTGWRLFPRGPAEFCPFCSGRGLDYRLALLGSVCQECDGFGEIRVLS